MVTQLMGLGWVGVMLTFVTRRGHSNRGFNCIFFACFHLSSFQRIGPWFPFACCRQLYFRKLEQPPAAFDFRFMRQHSRQDQPAKFASWKPFFGKFGLVDCCAGEAKPPKEAANDPLYGARPRSSNKDPAHHIAILSTSSSYSHLHIYHARILPGAQQGTRSRFFLSRRVGTPEITFKYFYIYIYLFVDIIISCHTWK